MNRDEFTLNVKSLSQMADTLEEFVKTLRIRVDEFMQVANDLPSGVTVFSQCDPRWAGDAMGTQGGTIKQYGCLMCSLASILKDAGYDTDPKRLNKYLNENGGYVNGAYLSSFSPIAKLGAIGMIQPVIFTPDTVPFGLIQKTIASGGYATAMVDFNGVPHVKDDDVKMHWIRLLDDGTNCMEPWDGKIMPVSPRFGKTPQVSIWRVALYNKISVGV